MLDLKGFKQYNENAYKTFVNGSRVTDKMDDLDLELLIRHYALALHQSENLAMIDAIQGIKKALRDADNSKDVMPIAETVHYYLTKIYMAIDNGTFNASTEHKRRWQTLMMDFNRLGGKSASNARIRELFEGKRKQASLMQELNKFAMDTLQTLVSSIVFVDDISVKILASRETPASLVNTGSREQVRLSFESKIQMLLSDLEVNGPHIRSLINLASKQLQGVDQQQFLSNMLELGISYADNAMVKCVLKNNSSVADLKNVFQSYAAQLSDTQKQIFHAELVGRLDALIKKIEGNASVIYDARFSKSAKGSKEQQQKYDAISALKSTLSTLGNDKKTYTVEQMFERIHQLEAKRDAVIAASNIAQSAQYGFVGKFFESTFRRKITESDVSKRLESTKDNPGHKSTPGRGSSK